MFGNYRFKYKVNKKEILSELKRSYVPQRKKLFKFWGIPYGSLPYLLHRPFSRLYSRFIKGKWYSLLSSLIKILCM